MRKRKLFSCILAGIMCLLPMVQMTAQAEDYWPSGPQIEGGAAVVMEASTGTVLYEKNAHEELYPASITKILTTLLVLENCDLQEEVTFSYDSVHNIERDSTHIFRDVGEIMTVEQCLYAVMLGSANDCAYAVAEHVGGGYENFVAMMNDRVTKLGCENTHFMNPHGLTHENHYTSAYDMALISQAALENDMFRKITATKRYTIPFTNKHPNEETPLVNHHKMLTNYMGETAYLYDSCIGGKTGYTDLARNTLVTFAEKDGMTLICVVMKENSKTQYTDTISLLNYCFDNFTMWNVAENEPQYQVSGAANMEIFGTTQSFVDLDVSSQIILPKTVPFEEAEYKLVEETKEQDVVAVWEYSYADRVVGRANITVTNAQVEKYPFHALEVEEKTFLNINVKYLIPGIFIIIFCIFLGILIFRFANDFYIIRHRMKLKKREKRRFKTIKKGKHTRWRRRW